MMSIYDAHKYQRFRAARSARLSVPTVLQELLLPILVFGCVGGIAWAIRGTNGWGGIDGTIVPGMAWGLLWYFVCWRKGIDARRVILWLGLGVSLGGEFGYGLYVSWIRGMFPVGDKILPISPWIGYLWFFIAGIVWAAPGGIFLGWALGDTPSWGRCIIRALLFLLLLTLALREPLIEYVGNCFVRHCPGLLFPHAADGIYTGKLDRHLANTVYINTQNFLVVVWWLLAMAVAVVQRDRRTLVTGAVLGGGFGPGFAQSAMWCLGYVNAPKFIDWWKVWELNSGFNLGLLYVLVLYWAIRQVDKTHDPDGTPKTVPSARTGSTIPAGWVLSMLFNAFVCLTLFGAFLEYAWLTGTFLCLFYVCAVSWTAWENRTAAPAASCDRKRSVLLVYSMFLLLFVLCHGLTSRAGVVLGLYEDEAIGQYQWPVPRLALFIPAVILLTGVAAYGMKKVFRNTDTSARIGLEGKSLPLYMIDLIAFVGFVGALTIWPDKVAIVYALFLCVALSAFVRLNRHLDQIDDKPGT